MSKRSKDVPLSAADREALIRAVFDATKAVAWASDWNEKRKGPVFANQSPEPLRAAYYRSLEKLWPEWQSTSVRYSNGALLDMYSDAAEQCDALAMLEFRDLAADGRRVGGAALPPSRATTSVAFARILTDRPDHTREHHSAEREQDRDRYPEKRVSLVLGGN
jgi:hypothetical protein